MTSELHIYTVPSQPATRFVDDYGPGRIWFRCKPRQLCRADCCGTLRWAKYVRVQVFYDRIYRSCSAGHGCRSGEPLEIRRMQGKGKP